MERVTTIRRHREPMTTAEFLAWENEQDEKYEYFDGVIRMMTGGTVNHSLLAENCRVAFRRLIVGTRCKILGDLKLATEDAVTYPDVMIVCDPPEGTATHTPQASVIVEVLSKSTERFDRGPKWEAYLQIESLQAYMMVSQASRRIDLFRRAGSDYLVSVVREGSFDFPGFAGAITVDEIYEGVRI